MKIDIDFTRLASFVEDLPPLGVREVSRIVDTFRRSCIRRFSFVDAPNSDRGRILENLDKEALFATRLATPGGAIAGVLRTPRALKSALRRCRSAWSALNGEVNFDDLLMVCTLYESNILIEVPSGRTSPLGPPERVRPFEAVGLARLGLESLNSSIREESARASKWKDLILSNATPEHEILGFLLTPMLEGRGSRPQGVAEVFPTDYLARIRAEEHSDVPRDQEVLQVLWAHRRMPIQMGERERVQIATWLCEGTLASDKVVQFRGYLSGSRLLATAETTIRMILADSRLKTIVQDGMDRPAPLSALIELAKILRDQRVSLKHLTESLRRWVLNALEVDLHAATEIEYWLFPDKSMRLEQSDFLREFRRQLVEDICATACEIFSGPVGVARITNAITPTYPYCLHHMIRREWKKPDEFSLPASSWTPIAPTLIEAAKIKPQTVGVAFAVLFTSTQSVVEQSATGFNVDGEEFEDGGVAKPFVRRRVAVFDEEFAREFLGPHFSAAMMVLREAPSASETVAHSVDAAKAFAETQSDTN